MSKRYMDWTDWAVDNHVEAEAILAESSTANGWLPCEHVEVSGSGYCTNCGEAVEGWEPADAQLLTHYGTKEPAA